jgi:hypothetical protein
MEAKKEKAQKASGEDQSHLRVVPPEHCWGPAPGAGESVPVVCIQVTVPHTHCVHPRPWRHVRCDAQVWFS